MGVAFLFLGIVNGLSAIIYALRRWAAREQDVLRGAEAGAGAGAGA